MHYITGLCILKCGITYPGYPIAIRYKFNFTKCSKADNHPSMASGYVDNMYESCYSEDKFKKGLRRRVGDIKGILDTPDKQKLIYKITEDENVKKKKVILKMEIQIGLIMSVKSKNMRLEI